MSERDSRATGFAEREGDFWVRDGGNPFQLDGAGKLSEVGFLIDQVGVEDFVDGGSLPLTGGGNEL